MEAAGGALVGGCLEVSSLMMRDTLVKPAVNGWWTGSDTNHLPVITPANKSTLERVKKGVGSDALFGLDTECVHQRDGTC